MPAYHRRAPWAAGLTICLLVVLPACATGPGAAAPSPADTAAPTVEQLRDAVVQGIYAGKTISLRNGAYEGAPFMPGGASRPQVTLLEGLTATGDLNGVAGAERVALLAESSGGTGVNVYLALVSQRGSEPVNIGTALVGDRVQLRGLDIRDATIMLDVLRPGPQDAMCCPTELARLTYRFDKAGLTLSSSVVTGHMSLTALAGAEWTLEEIDGVPLATGAQPPTLRIEGGSASGFGGCNRYSGPVTASAPGKIAFGNLAATRMACIGAQMDLEGEFFQQLSRVEACSFLEGRLALRWSDGPHNGLLLFRR